LSKRSPASIFSIKTPNNGLYKWIPLDILGVRNPIQ